jgi:hypothetical protein
MEMRSIMFSGGDIVINSKRLQMVEGLSQKMQRTRTALLTVLGELFYNADAGLNYSEILDVTEKNISNERKKIAIVEAMMKDSNVEKVGEISITTNRLSRKTEISLKLKYKDENTITAIGGVTVG